MLANASKIHEGKEMAEAMRLLVDISGGFVADLPSDRDLENPEVGDAAEEIPRRAPRTYRLRKRVKMYRLVEKLALESADSVSDIHGGGSPEAHRITILRESDLEERKEAAREPGRNRRLENCLSTHSWRNTGEFPAGRLPCLSHPAISADRI